MCPTILKAITIIILLLSVQTPVSSDQLMPELNSNNYDSSNKSSKQALVYNYWKINIGIY